MTCDDDFRMIKTVTVYRGLQLIVNSLKHFKDFLKLNFLSSEPMKLKGLLQIYLFSLVILYDYYEADTEADKVAPNVMARLGLVLHLLYLRGFIAMVSENLFDNFTAKGINLHQCKTKIFGGLQNKIIIYSVSQAQIGDHSCRTLTFLCVIQIMFVMLRYCCSCQLKLSGMIYQPNFWISEQRLFVY